jgi:hypothetical protein
VGGLERVNAALDELGGLGVLAEHDVEVIGDASAVLGEDRPKGLEPRGVALSKVEESLQLFIDLGGGGHRALLRGGGASVHLLAERDVTTRTKSSIMNSLIFIDLTRIRSPA